MKGIATSIRHHTYETNPTPPPEHSPGGGGGETTPAPGFPHDTKAHGGEHLQKDEGAPGPYTVVRVRSRFRVRTRWAVCRQYLPLRFRRNEVRDNRLRFWPASLTSLHCHTIHICICACFFCIAFAGPSGSSYFCSITCQGG